MASFRISLPLEISAALLFDAMTDPEMQQRHALAFKATKAKATRREEKQALLLELELEVPARSGGGIDRSTVSFTWDPAQYTATFSRRDHQHGDRVKVTGEIRIEATADHACVVHERCDVDIAIPLIGKTMARKIAAAMERKRATVYQRWLELARRTTSA